MERIVITRAEFEEHYGLKPTSSSMLFCTPQGVPLVEFAFVDELPKASAEIAELERIYKL